jgi:hypothetical protein
MKQLTEVLAIFVLACAVAAAQGAPAGTPEPNQTRQTPPDRDSSQSIPGQGTSSTNQGTGPNQGGSTPSTAIDSSGTDASHTGNNESKGGKKLKGCIRSENGKYMLETEHDQMVSLTGSQDFTPHIGHTVTLQGKFVHDSSSAGAMAENRGTGTGDSTPTGAARTGASSAASPSTGSSSTGISATGISSSGEGSNFQVTKMDMVSDRCTLEGRNGMKGGKESSHDHR